MNYAVLTVIVALATSALSSAHDYWMIPSSFYPELGRETAVRLYVGDRFVVETERAFSRTATTKLDLVQEKSTRNLIPTDGDDLKPMAVVKLTEGGAAWIRLDRAPRLITLAADKFTAYLKEEGLETIVDRRKELGESAKDGRERYSRCLKCYLVAGESKGELFRRALGQKLEIVPLSDPAKLRIGDQLEVRVLIDGKPLVGSKVFAFSRSETKIREQSATTSKDGGASFQIDRGGEWLVRLVHMERRQDKDADWESYWAALSFGVR